MKSISVQSLEARIYDSKFIDPLVQKKVPIVAPLTQSPPSYSSITSPISEIPPVTGSSFFYFPIVHSGTIQENLEEEISSIDIDTCGENGENAFFVCDVGHVVKQLYRWEKELGGLVEPFFAVKCNPDPVILALFAKLGLGFDCASHLEIATVLSNGVDPKKIIYANPCKASSFIRNAAKAGVHKMTFDNCDELVKVKRFFPTAELVLRLLTDDSESLCRLGLKFGARLDDVEMLLLKARELELNVIGVSFHVGSGCGNPHAFDDAIRRSTVAFKIATKLGFNFNFLDIGGGFNDNTQFEIVCDVIRTSLGNYFPGKKVKDGEGRDHDLHIIAEPGRYFVSRAFQLATNIIARRKKDSSTDETANTQDSVMYYINDGVYGAFNCTMFDHQVVHPKPLTVQRQLVKQRIFQSTEIEKSSVWGPTCDSIDLVTESAFLPQELGVGDWLLWENMGAYTICAASQFNGFKTSQVRYTIDGKGDTDFEQASRMLFPKSA